VSLSPLAHRFLHEGADLCLFAVCQLLQRESGRPHVAFVEVRRVVEAKSRVPCLELISALEEADDLAVLVCIRGHPVPWFRREGWSTGFDDSMEPLGHGTIRFRHLGDLREHGAFPVRLVRPQLLDTLLHRVSFLVRESLKLLVVRGGVCQSLVTSFHFYCD